MRARRRRASLVYVLVGLLLVLLVTPGSSAALTSSVDCSVATVGSGPGFCVLQQGQPMHLSVGTSACCPTYWTASGLTYLDTENVRDGSGNTFSVQHLRFTALSLLADAGNPVSITQPGTHYSASLTDSGPAGGGQDTVTLGGTDPLGNPMYTDMWGTVNDIRVWWWFLCQANLSWGVGIANNSNFTGCHIDVSVYAIKVTDSNPSAGQGATPLKIPNGHLSIASN